MECLGVPLYAWSLENLTRVGEQWGTVASYDEQTIYKSSFTPAMVLLDTFYYPLIQGYVHLSIDMNGYDVYMREVSRDYEAWQSCTRKSAQNLTLVILPEKAGERSSCKIPMVETVEGKEIPIVNSHKNESNHLHNNGGS